MKLRRRILTDLCCLHLDNFLEVNILIPSSSCSNSQTALKLLSQHIWYFTPSHKSLMERTDAFSPKSRNLLTESCRCSHLKGDVLRPVRCSTAHRCTQPVSHNFCRRYACFTPKYSICLTRILCVTHFSVINDTCAEQDKKKYDLTFTDAPSLSWRAAPWVYGNPADVRSGLTVYLVKLTDRSAHPSVFIKVVPRVKLA